MKYSIHPALAFGGISLILLAAFSAPPTVAGGPTPIDHLPFTIDSPGAYCVTQNLNAGPGETGITVEVSNVVIDLGGFVLSGPQTGSGKGITSAPGIGGNNVRVQNGTLLGWISGGIDLGGYAEVRDVTLSGCRPGIDLEDFARVESCFLDGNLETAVLVGDSSAVIDCQIAGWSDARGVHAGDSAIVQRVQVRAANVGIRVGSTAGVADCVVEGYTEFGIFAGNESWVKGCSAVTEDPNAGNGIQSGTNGAISDCISKGTPYTGIVVGHGGLVRGSTATQARTTGIAGGVGARILDSAATRCNSSDDPFGSGIAAYGEHASIRGCVTSENLRHGVLLHQEGGLLESNVSFLNQGYGLFTQENSMVRTNQLSRNSEAGLRLGKGGQARENMMLMNIGAGLHAAGNHSVIQDNQVDGNADGVVVEGHSTLITGNRAYRNLGEDYDVLWGNSIGPILNTDGAIIGSEPQANFGKP